MKFLYKRIIIICAAIALSSTSVNGFIFLRGHHELLNTAKTKGLNGNDFIEPEETKQPVTSPKAEIIDGENILHTEPSEQLIEATQQIPIPSAPMEIGPSVITENDPSSNIEIHQPINTHSAENLEKVTLAPTNTSVVKLVKAIDIVATTPAPSEAIKEVEVETIKPIPLQNQPSETAPQKKINLPTNDIPTFSLTNVGDGNVVNFNKYNNASKQKNIWNQGLTFR